MSKFRLLAITGSAAVVSAVSMALAVSASAVPVRTVAAAAGSDPATIIRSHVMTPVTGPYVGAKNPIRGVPGGGLPWIIRSGAVSLKQNGQLRVRVRGLVLADAPPVPPSLRGVNPIPDFQAIVSCQTIGAGNTATVTNVSTAPFPASMTGNSEIEATVKLPEPCIAPIVFVTSPGSGASWFASTGG